MKTRTCPISPLPIFCLAMTILISVIASAQRACTTPTFYMELPAVGSKIELKEIQTLPSGDFILGGNTITSSVRTGFLLRMHPDGTLSGQQKLNLNHPFTQLEDLKVFLNGKVVVGGFLNTQTAFISFLNPDLSVASTRLIQLPSTGIKLTLDLFDDDSRIAMAIQTSNSILMMSMDTNGNASWIKETTIAGITKLSGLSNLSWIPLALVANCVRNGKQTVEIMEIRKNDGALVSAHTIDNGGEESISFGITPFNNQLNNLGIVRRSDGSFRVVRHNFNTSAKVETRHEYPLPGDLNFNATGAMDNAADAMGIVLPQDGKLVLIKQFSYYTTTVEQVREYHVPTGSTISTIGRSFDGGYLMGLQNKDSSGIILIKTDSTGVLAGCGYATLPNNFTEEFNRSNFPSAPGLNSVAPAFSAAALMFDPLAFSTQFSCRQNYCPPAPVQDTCLSSFYKIFRSPSHFEGFSEYHLMRSNRHLVVSTRADRILGGGNQNYRSIKLLAESGTFIKGISLFADNKPASFLTRKVTDSTVLVVSYVPLVEPRYEFTLINDNLEVIWTRSVATYPGFEFVSAGNGSLQTHRDEEGNYYFTGTATGFNGIPAVLVYKMDTNGNPLWTKAYRINGPTWFEGASLASTPKSVIVFIQAGGMGVTARLDKSTGEMLNAWRYNGNFAGAVYERLIRYDNGRIFYAGNMNDDFVMSTFDTLGRPIKIRRIVKSSLLRAGDVRSSELYSWYNYYNGTGFRDVFLKADSNLNLVFYKEYLPLNYGYPAGMNVSADGNIYAGGSIGGLAHWDPFLVKLNNQGELGICSYSENLPSIVDEDPQLAPLSFSPLVRNLSATSIPFYVVPDTNRLEVSAILCSSAPQCNYIELGSPVNFCGLNTPHRIPIQKNAGCTVIPAWSFDPQVKLQQSTDSVAVFSFPQAGAFWLRARLNAGCTVYSDSILVTVSDVRSSLNIGRDTSLCPGNTILLNAGKGFASYQWQDGSADSTFLVTTPGIFWVVGRDACGNERRDTISVTAAIPPSFTPLSDRSKCNNDTIRLQADAGFVNYSWSPAYAISNTSQQSVIVNPQFDTAYYLKAEKTPGCFIYDTVLIRVSLSPPIDLGADTSFCQGQQILLQAPGSFNTYFWKDGSSGTQLTVNAAGQYWVTATTAEGCSSSDTLRVVNVYSNPVVQLPTTNAICQGTNLMLDPGAFSKYIWQDGSTGRSYTANTIGVYHVQVKDANGCTGSDTTRILDIYPPPSKFLPPDTAICNYSTVQLRPEKPFLTYLWSTGAVSSSIPVKNGGTYWLEVRDVNNCKGADTISIGSKDCLKGVYVPTAFTPNHDGRNDVFKPLVFGVVKSYQFSVYNRWGQLVFSSNDISKGWNGSVGGKEQTNHVFVWMCSYQFEGEGRQTQKGTVTLIK